MNISITNFSQNLVRSRSERQRGEERGGSGERRDKRHGERKNWGMKKKKENKGIREEQGGRRK